MKKKLKEEIRDPQENINKDLTSSVKKYLEQYMTRLGWTNEEQRNNFIEVTTQFIVSGQGANKQRLINSYLDKGLQVLNLEISKEQISTKNPDDGEMDSDNISENINKAKHLKKRLNEASKHLIDRNYTLDESKKTSALYLKENKKVGSLKNLRTITEQEASEEKEDVYLTNFKTFFRLYLTRNYKWTTETSNSVIDSMVEMVERSADDKTVQDTLNRRLNDLKRNIESAMSLESSPEEDKNLDVARSEFRKLAVSLNGWSGKLFSSVFSTLSLLLVNAKNVNIQRILVNKLSEIEASLPQKKENVEKEVEKDVEEEQTDKKQKEEDTE